MHVVALVQRRQPRGQGWHALPFSLKPSKHVLHVSVAVLLLHVAQLAITRLHCGGARRSVTGQREGAAGRRRAGTCSAAAARRRGLTIWQSCSGCMNSRGPQELHFSMSPSHHSHVSKSLMLGSHCGQGKQGSGTHGHGSWVHVRASRGAARVSWRGKLCLGWHGKLRLGWPHLVAAVGSYQPAVALALGARKLVPVAAQASVHALQADAPRDTSVRAA